MDFIIPRMPRPQGEVQVVSSSLPPNSKKKGSTRRRYRARGGTTNKKRPERIDQRPESSSKSETPEILLVDKQSICVDILAGGYVQSFVDFFYLTHRPDPIQENYSVGQIPDEINVNIEDMEIIKTHLVDAEEARRKPDQVTQVYSNLNQLALHFQERSDQRTGVYFYEKCLEIARIMQDIPGEMKATFDLGSAYQVMKDYLKAAEYQEQHLQLAQSHADIPEAEGQVELAYNQLKKTYTAYGELMEEHCDVDAAITYHKKCLDASTQTDDKKAEASAHYRLGRALVISDAAEHVAEGKKHLTRSLDLCNELGDIRGQGLAYASLAAMSQKSGQTSGEGGTIEALEHLKNFLRVSESTGNIEAQAEACHNLGAIYNSQGRFDRAVEFFEKNFRLCRQLVKDCGAKTNVVDKARVNLGMAKGNARMGKFMHIIYHDLKSLLYWKNSRQDIQ